MNQKMIFTFPAGKLVTNFATLGAVATNTFTVPAGKRWLIIYGKAERDANATFDAHITDGTNIIGYLTAQIAAGVTMVHLPNDGHFPCLPMLDAGYTVVYTWGAAQTTPEVSLVVLEMDA